MLLPEIIGTTSSALSVKLKKQYSIYFKNENNVGRAFVLLFIKIENVC